MNTTTLRDAIKTTLYDLTVSSFGSAVPSILRSTNRMKPALAN